MKTNFLRALATLCVALGVSASAAEYKLRFEQSGYTVPELASNASAVIKVYATFGKDVQNYKVNYEFGNAAGFSFDKDSSSFNSAIIVNEEVKPVVSQSGTKAITSITGQQATATIKETSTEVLVSTLKFNVTAAALASAKQNIDVTVSAIKSTEGPNLTPAEGSATSIEIPIYKSFNFAIKENAAIATEEGDVFTLTKDNFADYFTCQVWSDAEGALVDSTAVEFSDLSVGEATNEKPQVASLENGYFTVTPNEDKGYGEFVLSFKVKPAGGTGEGEQYSISVNVKPVNQEPTVAFDGELKASENEPVSFKVAYSDDETAFTEATKVVTFGGSEIEGTWDELTFTANDAISYDKVVHPKKEDEFDIKVAVTDNGKGSGNYRDDTKQTAEKSGSFKVVDVDRALVTDAATLTLDNSAPTVTDTVTPTATGAVDADGDAITYNYKWTWMNSDGVTCEYEGSSAKVGDDLQVTKGMKVTVTATAVVNPYGDEEKSNNVPASREFTVANSAPVATKTEYTPFIQKGQKTSVTVTIGATDADGDEKNAKVTSVAEGLSVSSEGLVLTIGVVDPNTEFSGKEVKLKVIDDWQEESEEITLKVTYKEDPAPIITVVTAPASSCDEVDGNGNGTVLTVKVTAQDDTSVAESPASGVKNFRYSLKTLDGQGNEVELDNKADAYVVEMKNVEFSEGAGVASIEYAITLGYETLQGLERPGIWEFTFSVSAVDGNGAVSAPKDFSFWVNDVDRKPADLSGVSIFGQNGVPYDYFFTGDVASGKVNSAVTDPDGDAVSYELWFAVKENGEGEFVEGSKVAFTNAADIIEWNINGTLKKNDIVKVMAKAIGKRAVDGNSLASEVVESTSYTVQNTRPYISKVGDKTSEGEDFEYTWSTDDLKEGCEAQILDSIKAADIDAEVGRDTLTFEVSALSNPEAGTISIEPSTGAVTFKPAENYNTVDTNEKLTFTIGVKDETIAEAVSNATVTIVVKEVNNQPTLNVADLYVLPDQIGEEQIAGQAISVKSFGDEYESSQALQDCEVIKTVVGEASIIDSVSIELGEANAIILKYTVKADTALGASEAIKVKVKDNGTTEGVDDSKWSEEYVVTIYVGASPWYPIVNFTPSEAPESKPDGYAVVLTEGTSKQTFIIRDGREAQILWPSDYIANGFKGYKDNAALTINAYEYSKSAGYTEENPLYEGTLTVSEYGLPKDFRAAGEAVVDNETGWVTLPVINVPMARGYKMSVYLKGDGNEELVYTNASDFQPVDASQASIIKSEIPAQQLQFNKSGDYAVKVIGYNPNLEEGTAEAEVLSFTLALTGRVEEEFTPEQDWGEDAVFKPADGSTLTSGKDVTFSWPVVKGAVSYKLYVEDEKGNSLVKKEIVGYNYSVETLIEGNVTEARNFKWYVAAFSEKGESYYTTDKSFAIYEKTDELIITRMTANETERKIVMGVDGLVNVGDKLRVEYQYFDVSSMTWTKGSKSITIADAAAVTMEVEHAIEAGDFLIIKYYVNGALVKGDWSAYQLQ